MKTGDTVIFKGNVVKIVKHSSGWYAVEDDSGQVHNVRAAALKKPPAPKASLIKHDPDNYKRVGKHYDVGDSAAEMLRDLDFEEGCALVAALVTGHNREDILTKGMRKATDGVEWVEDPISDFLVARYEHLNNGMRRMNISNILRTALKAIGKM